MHGTLAPETCFVIMFSRVSCFRVWGFYALSNVVGRGAGGGVVGVGAWVGALRGMITFVTLGALLERL